MTVYSFANIGAWSEKAKRNAILVARQSIQDVCEDAQRTKSTGGRMPVDTGFLRNSFTAGVDGAALSGDVAYLAAINGLQIGDTFNAGWTAAYARRMEYGFVGQDSLGRFYNTPGNFFMGGAIMRWPAFVAANAAKLK